MTQEQELLLWYVTRSAALTSWAFAAASVLLGLFIPARVLGNKASLPWLTDIHRFLGGASVFFLLIHMGTLWADTFVDVDLLDLIIPGRARIPPYSEFSLTLGVIAAWFLILVYVSSLIRSQLPDLLWKLVHRLSFISLILGSIHAIDTGTDIDHAVTLAIIASVGTAIVLGLVARLVRLAKSKSL